MADGFAEGGVAGKAPVLPGEFGCALSLPVSLARGVDDRIDIKVAADPIADLVKAWESLSARRPVRSPSTRCTNCWYPLARHAADGRCPPVVPLGLGDF